MVSTTNCILSAKQCSTVGPESPCSSGTFRPQPHSHGHNQVAFQPLLRGSSSTWQTVHHKLARGLIPSSVTSTANRIWLQPTPPICFHTLTNPEDWLPLQAFSTALVHTAPPITSTTSSCLWHSSRVHRPSLFTQIGVYMVSGSNNLIDRTEVIILNNTHVYILTHVTSGIPSVTPQTLDCYSVVETLPCGANILLIENLPI